VTFPTALANIGTHVRAAGTAVTPKILDVAQGSPVSVNAAMLRYWYSGDSPAPHYPGGQTLTQIMVGERVNVAAYFPASDRSVLAGLDTWVFAIKHELKTRLIGDSQLGGQCDDLEVGDAEVEYLDVGGALVVRLLIPLILDFGEAYTISA
jgi:hypothetical protein